MRTQLRVRSSLVQARTALVNKVRGTLRAQGAPLGSSATQTLVMHWAAHRIPRTLRDLLEPLAGAIGELTERIEALEEQLVELSRSDELLERLQEVPGGRRPDRCRPEQRAISFRVEARFGFGLHLMSGLLSRLGRLTSGRLRKLAAREQLENMSGQVRRHSQLATVLAEINGPLCLSIAR